ncbi:YihY family inner membrane protein [bacterium]|nr:YihY family inner membrane protein [bacterium]
MIAKKGWSILRTAAEEFQRDKGTRLAAALSYYTAISIAPLLVFVLLILGFFIGQSAAQSQTLNQLQTFFGQEGMTYITSIVETANRPTIGSIAGILSVFTLIWGSTNLFAYLQETLNAVWNVKPPSQSALKRTLKKRLLAFLVVLAIGFFLILSLLLSAILSVLSATVTASLPGGEILWRVTENVISLIIVSVMFGLVFKVLPNAEIRWRDVWPGALFTGILFSLAKIGLTIYLGQAAPGSAYGAAGSVIVFLLWVYVSAIILLYGAEVTKIYAHRFGKGIHPNEGSTDFSRRSMAAD